MNFVVTFKPTHWLKVDALIVCTWIFFNVTFNEVVGWFDIIEYEPLKLLVWCKVHLIATLHNYMQLRFLYTKAILINDSWLLGFDFLLTPKGNKKYIFLTSYIYIFFSLTCTSGDLNLDLCSVNDICFNQLSYVQIDFHEIDIESTLMVQCKCRNI